MNQVIQRVEASDPFASTLLMIERVATDPNVDVERLKQLLDMHERILARQAATAYDAALSEMQPELPSVEQRGEIKDAQGNVRSRYAKWEHVNEAIKPVLHKHGFGLSFRITKDEAQTTVTAVLSHKGGHREDTSITLPSDTSGSKNNVQAVGSTVSYGKRYTAGALLNLTSHGEDDDAFEAATSAPFRAWVAKIEKASTVVELDKIGADLAGDAELMKAEKTKLRSAFATRKKELKK
jgi:hypothetical protein